MTERQKLVLRSLIDGKRYTEIAREMGVTRQAVYDIAKKAIGHGGDYTDGYYPNIRRYISENCRSIADFADKTGVKYSSVHGMLKYGGSAQWTEILKMSEYTGMDIRTLMVREPVNDVQQA